jgi:lycopene cyclase domain-containing protein
MSVLSALLVSVPWDKMAVENEIWFFPKEGVLGISIGGLPLEEYLFISTVTLLVVTTTIIFKYQKSRINLYVGK